MTAVHLAEAIAVCLLVSWRLFSAAGATTHETSSEQLLFTTQDIKVTLRSINIIWWCDLNEIVNHM